jgi:glycosyl transferase, family 25
MQTRFLEHGIAPVRRVPAVDAKGITVPCGWKHLPGALACLQSHLSVVRQARQRRIPRVLIFEDDVVFDTDFTSRFARSAAQIPVDWDMLFLGGTHWEAPTQVSEHVVKATATAATHAYALNHTIYDAFIDLNNRGRDPVDVNNTLLQRTFQCYCLQPHLTWQEEDYSDILGRAVHPWRMKESLVANSRELALISEKTAVIIAHRGGAKNPKALRNLHYLVAHYHRIFPGIEIVIVAPYCERGVACSYLPYECSYAPVPHASRFTRGQLFNIGFAMCDHRNEYFIFTNDNIVNCADDIKANLIMCSHYDFVSSYRDLILLTDRDLQQMLENSVDGLEVVQGRQTQKRRSPLSGSFMLSRRGLRIVGRVNEKCLEMDEAVLSSRIKDSLSIFESPSHALRLPD